MEMKRMFLALSEELPTIEAPKCEESVEGHTSDSVPQGSAEVIPVTNKDRSLGSESTNTSDLLDFKTFLDKERYSGVLNKKPHGYVEPKRLSVAKQKTKKQRAKMAKASKRVNRNK